MSATRSQNGCARSALNFSYWSGDHAMSQNVGDLANDLLRILSVGPRHVEQNLEREVVEENARRHEQGRHGRHARPKLAADLLEASAGEHPRIALPHLTVELLDVRAIELDDVDVDQSDVRPKIADAVARCESELLEIARKIAGRERARVRIALALADRPELVEQRAEDLLLVLEVMVDVARRHAGLVGNLAHRRRAISLMGEEVERRVENLALAMFGAALAQHCEIRLSKFQISNFKFQMKNWHPLSVFSFFIRNSKFEIHL